MQGVSQYAGISHNFGADITVSASGDILTTSAIPLETQRLLRRLMTNPGAYVFHREYGAGLGRFVGKPTKPVDIRAVILSQMVLEASVDQSSAPTINVVVNPAGGNVFVSIKFVYAPTGAASSLIFKVTN